MVKNLVNLARDSIYQTGREIRGSAQEFWNEDEPSLAGIGLASQIILSPLTAVGYFVIKAYRTPIR